jgi:Fe-S cluster assembly protein SufD
MANPLEPYIAEWGRTRLLKHHEGADDSFTHTREEAFHRFLACGLPTSRDEEWRFTSVAPIASRSFVVSTGPAPDVGLDLIRPSEPRLASAADLVFINGRFAPGLSRQSHLPAGTRVESLAASLAGRRDSVTTHLTHVAPFEREPFVALNTAFLDDGACIELPAGAILEEPIVLSFVTTGETDGRPIMAHPRILVILGENSQASIIERYSGAQDVPYFTNTVTEIVLRANAVLNHYKLQYEGFEASHIGAAYVQAQRSAVYASHSVSLGGGLVRNDLVAVLSGEGVECTLNGLYAAGAQRLVDNHTTIDHAQPHCASREIYKGILAGRARGVFNGKIIVRPDAQKTDAKQTNRALLLSEDAQINTKPQLEIFANDVKCTHGAAVGQLDDEALFYLRSRGLSDGAARRLLIHAFASDVLNRLPLHAVRTSVEDRLHRQLASALPAAA